MPRVRFPDPAKCATPEGIVGVGGNLHPETLLEAYRQGIFPWPVEGIRSMLWFCPEERAVLEFADLRVPRSISKLRRRAPFRFTVDRDFRSVIEACARVKRAEANGTWLTREMIEAYSELHELGHAHSVEAWEGEELAGGLYGVDVDGAFAGESMFFRRPNASKLALLHLIEHLAASGLDWIDIQVMTPHMEAIGAKLIRRERFLDKLRQTRARGLKRFP